ncbi:hypothetical protein BTR23_16275 [Alkalihalophilus pseudofirmus]|nr:hypothetical protein BTR23_16275 [Alkalihalophilus pseudofirmus]
MYLFQLEIPLFIPPNVDDIYSFLYSLVINTLFTKIKLFYPATSGSNTSTSRLSGIKEDKGGDKLFALIGSMAILPFCYLSLMIKFKEIVINIIVGNEIGGKIFGWLHEVMCF